MKSGKALEHLNRFCDRGVYRMRQMVYHSIFTKLHLFQILAHSRIMAKSKTKLNSDGTQNPIWSDWILGTIIISREMHRLNTKKGFLHFFSILVHFWCFLKPGPKFITKSLMLWKAFRYDDDYCNIAMFKILLCKRKMQFTNHTKD